MLCLLLGYIILAIAYMDARTYDASLDLDVLYRRTKASYVESFGLNSDRHGKLNFRQRWRLPLTSQPHLRKDSREMPWTIVRIFDCSKRKNCLLVKVPVSSATQMDATENPMPNIHSSCHGNSVSIETTITSFDAG